MNSILTRKLALIVVKYAVVAFLIVASYSTVGYFFPHPTLFIVLSIVRDGMPIFLITLSLACVSEALKTVFKGFLVDVAYRTLRRYAVVLIVFFLLNYPLAPRSIQTLSYPIFYILSIAVGYDAASSILHRYNLILLPVLIKSSAIFIIGLIFREAVSILFPPNGVLTIPVPEASQRFEMNVDLVNVVTIGFLFATASVLFTPLKYSENRYISEAGRLLDSSASEKFLIGVFLATYLLYLRPYFAGKYLYQVILVEWIFLGLISWSVYSGLKWRVKERMVEPLSSVTWGKHEQLLDFKSSEELNNLSEYIDEFVNDGLKENILVFLFSMLHEKGYQLLEISDILHELIDYRDLQLPNFAFSWEVDKINRENVKRRKQVLINVIEEIKLSEQGFLGRAEKLEEAEA